MCGNVGEPACSPMANRCCTLLSKCHRYSGSLIGQPPAMRLISIYANRVYGTCHDTNMRILFNGCFVYSREREKENEKEGKREREIYRIEESTNKQSPLTSEKIKSHLMQISRANRIILSKWEADDRNWKMALVDQKMDGKLCAKETSRRHRFDCDAKWSLWHSLIRIEYVSALIIEIMFVRVGNIIRRKKYRAMVLGKAVYYFRCNNNIVLVDARCAFNNYREIAHTRWNMHRHVRTNAKGKKLSPAREQ